MAANKRQKGSEDKGQKGSEDKGSEEKDNAQRRRLREAPDSSSSNASKVTANSTAGANGNGTAAAGPTRFIIPLIAQLTGYDQTAHAKQHDIRKAFVPSDCDPPGTSTLKGRRRR